MNEYLWLNFLKNIKYNIVINTNGIDEIIIFLNNESDINLIVVSEKIIKNKPIRNVISFNFEYLEFSFDRVIKRKGVKDKIKM